MEAQHESPRHLPSAVARSTVKKAMKQRAAICTIVGILYGSLAFGQPATASPNWSGTWALSLPESELSGFWIPGAPEHLTVISQNLEIAAAPGHLKIIGDIVTSELGASQQKFDLGLDGKETGLPGGLRLAFRRIDDRSFDVIAGVNSKRLGNHIEEMHFVFSADGDRVTETITRTEREVVPEDGDQGVGVVIGRSTSVLVFYKLFIPRAGPVYFRRIQE
jgi:hypothetical protein